MSGDLKSYIKDWGRKVHISWLRAKLRQLPELEIKGNVVIVAPHPDDEVIGCGGLIRRLIEKGTTPYVIVMTGGGASHKTCCQTPEEVIITERRKLTHKALGILGLPEDHIIELDFTDGSIGTGLKENKDTRLGGVWSQVNPDHIFVPHWGEGWKDHINTAKLVKENIPDKTVVWEYCVWMWYYNVWKGLDWSNSYELKLSEKEFRLKQEAMDAYLLPKAPCGKPWSGLLPKIFVNAHKAPIELYFRNTV